MYNFWLKPKTRKKLVHILRTQTLTKQYSLPLKSLYRVPNSPYLPPITIEFDQVFTKTNAL